MAIRAKLFISISACILLIALVMSLFGYGINYGISLSLSDVEDREADRPYRDVVVRLRQFHPHAGILTLSVLGFTSALTFTSDGSGLRSGLATRRTFARGA